MRRQAVALVASIVGACGASAGPEPAVLGQNVVNGSPTQDYPAVVQLQLNIAGGERYNCTGSLIAQDLVLTAAHCLPEYFWIDDQPRKLETVDVFFGHDDSQPPVARIPATRWCRNPKAPLRDTPPGVPGAQLEPCSMPHAPNTTPVRILDDVEPYAGRFDTAVVYLQSPAPASITPLPLSFQLPAIAPEGITEGRIVGFGATAVDAQDRLVGNGIKRVGTAHVRGLFDGEDDGLERYVGTLQIARADGAYAATCKEDSGSPLFMQMSEGNWQIVATTSHGDPDCNWDVQYAPLSESAEFISKHLPL